MSWLILGMVLFFGPHSVRLVADDWRSATIARIGEPAWKGLYTLVSIIGLVVMKTPAIPGLFAGVLLAAIMSFFQGNDHLIRSVLLPFRDH